MQATEVPSIEVQATELLASLEQTIRERLAADVADSYVAKLNAKGLDAILKKIGEEATETVMAAKDGDKHKVIYETADLWFHCMVLLAHQDIDVQDIINELSRRMGTSGLAEKAARQS